MRCETHLSLHPTSWIVVLLFGAIYGLMFIKAALVRAADKPAARLAEASGVVRSGNALLIVTDQEDGCIFKLPLVGNDVQQIDLNKAIREEIPGGRFAVDLEAAEVLDDGGPVVLSERLRYLIAADGNMVAMYEDPFGEFGERGLEGIAVRDLTGNASRVAVLWEGGYPEFQEVPPQLRGSQGWLPPLKPVVVVHDLQANASGVKIELLSPNR